MSTTSPRLTKINDDKFTLRMPGYSRKFYLNTEELEALKDQINKEISK